MKQIIDPVFKTAELSENQYFVGLASAQTLVEIDDFNCPIWNVVFEAKSRNNWHKHPGGQILLVIDGEGYYQERGSSKKKITKGDVVKIPPDKEHWHGATENSKLVHLAIGANINLGIVEWLEPVSDEEYYS
ncbi:MAG: cupin domain-containing protein [Candidatus Gastranaerophilales bacterium]|nr:cupin domain-containing protein [Candidatus Gastranaerophilales bacterium]